MVVFYKFMRERVARPLPLLIVVLAGLGTAHILVRTATYGAAVTTDTILHLSTALNLLAGEGYREFTGLVVAGWPPLFTLLLAAFGWVGIEPLAAGRWVNAAAFGLTLLASGLYLHSNLRSRLLALAASVVILTALPLNHFASYCITEPLFVLFTCLALMQLAAFLNRKTNAALYWAAVFTALAALTRYAGVALIGVGVLVLLPLARWKHTLVFGAISSLPLLAVLAHDWTVRAESNYDTFWENDLVIYALYGKMAEEGEGAGSGQSLSAGLSQTVEVFRAWVVPPNAPDEVASLLWLAVGAVVLAGAVVSCHPNRQQAPEAAPPSFGLGPALLFWVFALTYLVFIIAVVPFVVGHEIPARYLLPAYVPLLLAAALLLDQFLSIKATGRMVAARYGLASLILLGGLTHIGFSARRNLTITAQARVAGYEQGAYNDSYWESSEILNYIRGNRINDRIYSNDDFLAWFYDRTAAPGKHQLLPDEIQSLTSSILRRTADDSAYILWFRKRKRFYDFDDLDIRCLPGVEPVAELSDGVVFRVTASEPFDEDKHRARKQRYMQGLIEQAGEPVVRADWDVYRKGRKLTYRKKPCAAADTQAMFVLHAIPLDPADLPAHRRPYGFDLLDFYFHVRGGIRLDDQCVASVQLPDYAISRIRIGQWIADGNRTLWETTAEPFNADRHRAQRQRYVDQLIEQASEQVARAGWSVYRKGRKLIYRKEPCAPADVQAKIVLHVTPIDPNELPANRQRHGFDSLGFYFDQRGFRLDDQCIAIAQLPDYAIGHIRVGQWISKGNRTVWEAEFAPGR